jgi:histidinol-phosphatase (PHP family)
MLPDLHMHTPRCKHAQGEPEAYAQAARAAGLTRIVFTDHAPLDDEMDRVHRMTRAELLPYHAEIRVLAESWRGRLEIGVGLELDWLAGYEEWIRAAADAAPWDLCLGSVHFVPAPAGWEFIIRRPAGTEQAILAAYWQAWGDAAESGFFQALSHPDVYRSVERDPLPGERELACRALDRAARAGVAVECNTSLIRKGGRTLYPAPWLLEDVLARGIPLSSASDAHRPEQVGSGFQLLEELARDPRARFLDFRGGLGVAVAGGSHHRDTETQRL